MRNALWKRWLGVGGSVATALACGASLARAQGSVTGDVPVAMVADQWTLRPGHSPNIKDDSARFVEHGGRTALFLPDGFAFANNVALRNGTIDADVEAYPNGGYFGLAFHVASADKYENVYFSAGGGSGVVQYAPSFFDMNAWQFFPPPGFLKSPDLPVDQWFHVRIVLHGSEASVFVDTAHAPVMVIHELAQGSSTGSVGFWGRYGGGYLSNVHYRPDVGSPGTELEFAL